MYVCTQVSCPSELYLATGIRRSDEVTTGYTCSGATKIYVAKPNAVKAPMVTRKMDCSKPYYGFTGTLLDSATTSAGFSVVVPCRRDGYARINSIPTQPPTAAPTFTNTVKPTRSVP
jgi:hypothetical protein